MITKSTKTLPRVVRHAVSVALASAAVGAAGTAQAVEFNLGEWQGSLNTTLSWGQTYRIENRDTRLIGTADGGTGRSPNIDDGNINYDKGLVSNAAKGVMELALSKDAYGLFVRGSALYDYAVEERSTERTAITEAGKDLAGTYTRLLDAFVYGRWDLSGHELEVRAGRQVVNWGESTFIQGGINGAINPFDVSAIRVPGAELREAYLPQEMLKVSYAITENVTAEAIALFRWDRTEPEPVGSYFASNDFVPEGGNRVFLGFGAFSDQGVDFRPLGGSLISDFQGVNRTATRPADDSGQYGMALRWYLPNFSDGTEFGVYFMNYHSKLPLISGRTGTQAGIGNAIGALTATIAAAQGLASGLPFASAVGVAAATAVGRATTAGGNMSLATATEYATIAANTALRGGSVSGQANNLATHEYAKTASYFTEYPEDITLFGLSFNTQLGMTGVALQGEVSYRQDVPLQYDDVELLFAALGPVEGAALAAQGIPMPATCTASLPTVTRCNQLGVFGLNQEIRGWGEFDVIQAQMTATKALPPMLGASQVVTVLEVGATHVDNMPDRLTGGPTGRGLRFNGPGTSVSGNAILASRHFNEVEPQNRFADETSWGYRVAVRMDYLGLVGPWNVSPRLVWSHDVNGTTPGPGGNFVDGRYGATVGFNANYQSSWEVDVSYTQFGGASRYNELTDRDFIAATVKYSF